MITSRSNARIARVRALRRRAERERSGLFLAEGIRVVVEAVALGAELEEVVVAPAVLRSDLALGLVGDLARAGVACIEVSPEVFESISSREGPTGLAAVVRQRWEILAQVNPAEGLCWLALDSVQDPGNLGTILRTADAVGAVGVILLGETADPYDSIAVRASTVAVFSRRLVRATFGELAAWKRENGVALVGTSGRAVMDYRTASYGAPLALLMGGEQRGLSEEQLADCDHAVAIPMVGRCDSLNLAVATAVVLYEVLRQRSG